MRKFVLLRIFETTAHTQEKKRHMQETVSSAMDGGIWDLVYSMISV